MKNKEYEFSFSLEERKIKFFCKYDYEDYIHHSIRYLNNIYYTSPLHEEDIQHDEYELLKKALKYNYLLIGSKLNSEPLLINLIDCYPTAIYLPYYSNNYFAFTNKNNKNLRLYEKGAGSSIINLSSIKEEIKDILNIKDILE